MDPWVWWLVATGVLVVAAGEIADVLTPVNLSTTFGLELDVERRGDRWSARAR